VVAVTSLIRWDPFAEISSLRRAMDRLFDDFMSPRLWRAEGEWAFPVDVYETDEAVVVKAALPGMNPDDVEISLSNDALTIRGEVKQEEKTERENYYRRELRYGSFARTVPLPTRVDQERAEAEFENGLLTVTLPKAEELRPKSIKVRVKEAVGARK
jgi:HSP20 family protein